MLYHLNIEFEKQGFIDKQNLYYAILGAFLNLFEKNKIVYESIIKLSFSIHSNFVISFVILGEKNYNYIVSELLKTSKKDFSINGNKMNFKQLKFDFKIFDINKIKTFFISKRTIYFNSPTRIKNKNINYLLPEPERFIFSAFQKLKKLYGRELDDKDFKSWLKYNIYAGEFDLKTKQVVLKKGAKHSGVVGYCKYYCTDLENEFNKYLCLTLQAMKFVGIGSGTKLGLGNVSVKW